MSNRITVDNEFDIEFDGTRCYTLIHKKVITGTGRGSHLLKNKDSIGKIREIELGFYSSLPNALIAYTDKCMGSRASNLEEVMKVIKNCEENIKNMPIPKQMEKVAVSE